MGQTRVIYSDATTAEASTVLKACGFLESNQGGLFINPNIPVKVYVVWGKSSYFPEMLARLDFPPRIQVHLKSREDTAELSETTLGVANGLRGNSPGTLLKIFNADSLAEMEY